MVEPLHLVELAAQRLRKNAASAPETALLPDTTAEEIVEPVAHASDASPPPPAPRLAVETLEGAGMLTCQGQRDRMGEEFRIIAQQILAGVDSATGTSGERNLVMVTSAVPREGKSFASLNLAANLALDRHRAVVLVDADIGPGSLSKALGLESETGLLDLAGSPDRAAESALVRSRIDSLSVLPIGGGTDGAGRALISAHYPIAGVIAEMARRFPKSLFVVDTPACLSSSDPAAIAAIAGQTLLVVEAEKTRRPQIEAALDLIDACQNIKLMLNKIRMATSETFGAYS